MVRETSLHTGHLRTMTTLSELGAVIAPPVPALYTKPVSIEEMVDHTLGRVMDLFDIDLGTVRRWRDPAQEEQVTLVPARSATSAQRVAAACEFS
jgi:4-hydroxy-3-polyprenylbenzoate decarboxylase